MVCLECSSSSTPVDQGHPGASAQREYDRRHQRREDYAREALGGFGVFLSRVIDEPASTKVWRQGANGEIRTAERLAQLLADTDVRLLHDRRIPRHGRANIDHIAIGPGGITVIDSKTNHGRIRVERVGGLFAPRRSVLMINGRDRTRLIDGVERQIELVRQPLSKLDPFLSEIDIRAHSAFPTWMGCLSSAN